MVTQACVGVGQVFLWPLGDGSVEADDDDDDLDQRVNADVDQLPCLSDFPLGNPVSPLLSPSCLDFMENQLATSHYSFCIQDVQMMLLIYLLQLIPPPYLQEVGV